MIHRIVSLGISGIVHELRYRLKRRRPSHLPSLEPGATPLVSVLCATNRPEQLAHLLATFDTQTWTNRELIVVTNADGFDLSAIAERQDVLVCPTPTETSLGACLNIGRQVATGQILARIDDDDSYSASYLDGVVKTFQQVDAAIVGKQEYFAYVVSTDQTYRRFPGRANRYVGRVAGGTIAELRSLTAAIAYPDKTEGEDIEFVHRCERAGLRIWAADPAGYVQHRRGQGLHTWNIADQEFISSAEEFDIDQHGC